MGAGRDAVDDGDALSIRGYYPLSVQGRALAMLCWPNTDEAMPTRAPRRPIDVHVFPSFRAAVKAPWLRKVAAEALAAADPDGAGGVSIALADDETLRSLNARFRGLDEVTDVLSFESEPGEGEPGEGEERAAFPTAPDGGTTIGEVVLSYPLAVRQADEHHVTAEEEVALLVVHGVLHLLGHDHEEPGDEARMKRLERQALAGLFGSPAQAGGA